MKCINYFIDIFSVVFTLILFYETWEMVSLSTTQNYQAFQVFYWMLFICMVVIGVFIIFKTIKFISLYIKKKSNNDIS